MSMTFGSGDYFERGVISWSNQYVLAGWSRRTGTTGTRTIASMSAPIDTVVPYALIRLDTTNLHEASCNDWNGPAETIQHGSPAQNTWGYLFARFKASSGAGWAGGIYANWAGAGVMNSRVPWDQFRIGRSYDANTDYYIGQLAHVRFAANTTDITDDDVKQMNKGELECNMYHKKYFWEWKLVKDINEPGTRTQMSITGGSPAASEEHPKMLRRAHHNLTV